MASAQLFTSYRFIYFSTGRLAVKKTVGYLKQRMKDIYRRVPLKYPLNSLEYECSSDLKFLPIS